MSKSLLRPQYVYDKFYGLKRLHCICITVLPRIQILSIWLSGASIGMVIKNPTDVKFI